MFRWIRALFRGVIGWFGGKADDLASNKHVMSATYDAAIGKGADRFETVRNAIAELMGIEETLKSDIKSLTKQMEEKSKVQTGAKVAMQRRINALREEGKTKEEIGMDGEFMKHKAAYEDASSTFEQLDARIGEKEASLKERQNQTAKLKIQLQQMQRNQSELKEEKQEALADVAIAQQTEAANNILAGVSTDSTDKDLEGARSARQRAKARANIMTELTGNDAAVAENEYLAMASADSASSELDGLLDWGDEEKESPKQDAQVPE